MSARTNPALRIMAGICLVIAAVAAAYYIVATTAADRLASTAPTRALRWQHHQPVALLATGRQQLAVAQPAAAAATLRKLLAVEPLQGEAFAMLASMDPDPESKASLRLRQVALQRAPRDVQTRIQLMQSQLIAHQYPDAMQQLGLIMQVDPARGGKVLQAVTGLVDLTDFADALVAALQANPPWRADMLRALQAKEAPKGAAHVLGALRQKGSVDDKDFGVWLDSLMSEGHWGEAYGRWTTNLTLTNGVLPTVYNGSFDTKPSDIGFDWRLKSIPGVLLEFVPDPGADGLVAHATFLGRAVPQVNVEQPLLLVPGQYRLTARMRAERLRSDRGLEWDVSCADNGTVLSDSERVEGSFGWRQVITYFEIPADCNAQWLRLRNPAPSGSAQTVSGDIWFDDIEIQRQPNPRKLPPSSGAMPSDQPEPL